MNLHPSQLRQIATISASRMVRMDEPQLRTLHSRWCEFVGRAIAFDPNWVALGLAQLIMSTPVDELLPFLKEQGLLE